MNTENFIKLINYAIGLVNDSWVISYIDFDKSNKLGWINFTKNDKYVKHDDGYIYHENELYCIIFETKNGNVLKSERSHEVQFAAYQPESD